MQLTDLKTLLEVLSSVGIDQVILEPSEEGTLVRGAKTDASVVVFDTIPEELTDIPVGVQNVKALLSRVRLFDETKATISIEGDEDGAENIVVKQGRKKASYRCAHPKTIDAPSVVPGEIDGESGIVLSREYVEQFDLAINSMSHTGVKERRYVEVEVSDNVASVTIFDGEDDKFTDELQLDECPDVSRAAWGTTAFHRVLRQSLDAHGDKAIFSVNEYGVAIFDLRYLKILVAPFAH